MAQRNPMNERYQNDKPAGKTRKSAGRAKPAKGPATPTRGKTMEQLTEREKSERRREQEKVKRRMKADQQRTMTKDEKKEQQKKEAGERPQRAPMVVPTTPEYKRWRTIWWVLLGIAVLTVAVAWLGKDNLASNKTFMYGSLLVSYAAIFGALGIDFVKIRPMRRAAQEEALAAQKSGKKRKELEAAVAEEAEKKGARKSRKEPEIVIDGTDEGDNEEDN